MCTLLTPTKSNQVLDYGPTSGDSCAAVSPSRPELSTFLAASPFQAYTYAYPHKTSYRPLTPPAPLDELWAGEERDALFLYLHVPFCEMRCGFCNLFTQSRPGASLPERYMEALERQARRVGQALGEARFSQVAFGGGTPTQLEPAHLSRLFDLVEELGAPLAQIPVAIETSPETATSQRLEILAQRGVDRVSIGIQSFVPAELKALGRPQSVSGAVAALDRIRDAGFPRLNIDLIYGIDGQDVRSWRTTLRQALGWHPEELYLYPLYLRPMTGLGKLRRHIEDHRLELYRVARDLLLGEGYEQFSMRCFRKPREDGEDSVYRCQEDGMVGLGCGARSYTRALHYSDEWAVSALSVKDILARWVERDADSFSYAWNGFELDGEEQRRRYLLQSLLNTEGLDRKAYRQCFDTDATDDFVELAELLDAGLAALDDERLVLNARGLELSDAIGPWLFSDRVRHHSEEFVVR
jgi:oxygen-independent coproporphyrinogen-3 oxidase